MPREPRDDAALLFDMLTYARKAVEFVHGMSAEEYCADEKLRMAVERAIEIIGEAARHLSVTLKDAHPHVPWILIEKQRHVLAHDYGEIENDRIWRVATIHIPVMIPQLEAILATFPLPPPPPFEGAGR